MAKKNFNNSFSQIIENASSLMHGSSAQSTPPAVEVTTIQAEGEKNIAFRIPKPFHRRLRMYTAHHEVSIKDLIIEMLEERMSQDGY